VACSEEGANNRFDVAHFKLLSASYPLIGVSNNYVAVNNKGISKREFH
jgi:hypothetical protein